MKISIHKHVSRTYDGSCYGKNWQTIKVSNLPMLAVISNNFAWSPILWKGGERNSKNFIEATCLGVDIDHGISLAEAINNYFCDMTCFITTTKSHQVMKNDQVCDRFRIILPLAKPIRDLGVYTALADSYIKKYSADPTCKDGARFFWPGKDTIFMELDGETEDAAGVKAAPKTEKKLTVSGDAREYFLSKGFTGWLGMFLDKGVMPTWTSGRNDCCYMVAKHLLTLGFDTGEIEELLKKAPFKKEGFRESEYRSVINSAVNTVGRKS